MVIAQLIWTESENFAISKQGAAGGSGEVSSLAMPPFPAGLGGSQHCAGKYVARFLFFSFQPIQTKFVVPTGSLNDHPPT